VPSLDWKTVGIASDSTFQVGAASAADADTASNPKQARMVVKARHMVFGDVAIRVGVQTPPVSLDDGAIGSPLLADNCRRSMRGVRLHVAPHGNSARPSISINRWYFDGLALSLRGNAATFESSDSPRGSDTRSSGQA
jgi:hypothetical protein